MTDEIRTRVRDFLAGNDAEGNPITPVVVNAPITIHLERAPDFSEQGSTDIYIGHQEISRTLQQSALGAGSVTYDEVVTVPVWGVTFINEPRMLQIIDALDKISTASAFRDFYSIEKEYSFAYNDTNEVLTYNLIMRRTVVDNR